MDELFRFASRNRNPYKIRFKGSRVASGKRRGFLKRLLTTSEKEISLLKTHATTKTMAAVDQVVESADSIGSAVVSSQIAIRGKPSHTFICSIAPATDFTPSNCSFLWTAHLSASPLFVFRSAPKEQLCDASQVG